MGHRSTALTAAVALIGALIIRLTRLAATTTFLTFAGGRPV
jgi:hypothetical protein